jgi:hypothetical protein
MRDGAGVEHAITIAGTAASIADFKPGFSQATQAKRKN